MLLVRIFGYVWPVYNHYREAKTKSYEETGKSLSYTKCVADLVDFKKEKAFLGEVDSIALQQTLHCLAAAFRHFFRDKKVGFPKYKPKKQHHDSYSSVCVNNNI